MSRWPELNWRHPLYESGALPTELQRPHNQCRLPHLAPIINLRPSCARLLGRRFGLPFPLLRAAYVGDKESQFGHTKRRFSSLLFLQLPSIWSATKGMIPVFGLILAQPHRQHLLAYFLRRYFLTYPDTSPKLTSPLSLPCFHAFIYDKYSYSC